MLGFVHFFFGSSTTIGSTNNQRFQLQEHSLVCQEERVGSSLLLWHQTKVQLTSNKSPYSCKSKGSRPWQLYHRRGSKGSARSWRRTLGVLFNLVSQSQSQSEASAFFTFVCHIKSSWRAWSALGVRVNSTVPQTSFGIPVPVGYHRNKTNKRLLC